MDQIKITEKTLLLDENGKLSKPGYCEYNRYVYNRDAIKTRLGKIKEWDYYQISDDRHTIHFNIFDVSYAGSFVFSVFDRVTGQKLEKLSFSLMTFGKLRLEEDTNVPHAVCFSGPDCYARVVANEGKRHLYAKYKSKGINFEVNIFLEYDPSLQSLVMAVPFDDGKHFYLNQKMNSMIAHGTIKAGDCIVKEFSADNSFGVLDWGRGMWPHNVKWYWGNGNTHLPDGHILGFEIGWGFGNMSYATENAIFYDGVCHKIEEVYLEKDENDYMKPWYFTSNDGRFNMTMIPEYDNFSSSKIGDFIGNECHQVFGKWSGTVTLDDGTVIEVEDMLAFCEESHNLW